MKCPFCGCQDNRVLDSRPNDNNTETRRRRECASCGKRFTTYERIETTPLIVIKKDNNREPYNRAKIEKGVLSACYKRPVPAKTISEMIDDVEGKIFASGNKEIESKQIGQLVMNALKDVDQVAYVRFASVYREFKDVNTFIDEIKKLQD